MSNENGLNDEELERLEELRRHGDRCHGDRCHGDNEDDDYYTLPPPRSGLLHEWTSWRTKINDMMVDRLSIYPNSDQMKRDRDLLTSPTELKTPKFFRGELAVNGQRVKDQYGGHVIEEDDDFETRQEKKTMERNFYLFGIPRISVRRCFGKSSDTFDGHTHFRRQSSTGSARTCSLHSSVADLSGSKQEVDFHTPDKRLTKSGPADWQLASHHPMIAYNPRSISQKDITNFQTDQNNTSRNGSKGLQRRFSYLTSASNKQSYKEYGKRRGRMGTELMIRDDRFL